MSGARPENPEELAGEYVLGVLGSAEMRAVDQQAMSDPRLARAIAGWERRLAPMLTAVPEVAPPDALWARIAHAKSLAPDQRQEAKPSHLTPVPSVPRPPTGPTWLRPAAAPRVWPWKLATVGSLALAAGMAAIMLIPALALRPSGPMVSHDIALVAVLDQPESHGDARSDTAPQMATDTGLGRLIEPSASAEPASAASVPPARLTGFVAAAWPDGTVVLTAFAPVPVPGGKVLELWIEPPDAAAPKSLGVLPADGRQTVLLAVPVAGTALSVTVEPPGGSPTGAPTGHVVYSGTLRPIRR